MPCIVFLSTGDPSSRPNADDNFDSFAASKCHPRFCNCFFRDACLAARRFCRLDGPRSLITFTPKPSFPSVLLRCYAYCQAAAYHGGNSNFGMVHPWRRITLVPIEGLEYVEEAVTALGPRPSSPTTCFASAGRLERAAMLTYAGRSAGR